VNFDRIAAHYRWLETIVFGNQLQQARIAFLREIEAPRRVLIVGEGNGRFLAELLRIHPQAQVDCIEASACMIALARDEAGAAQVAFIQADVRTLALVKNSYDLIVTHFLLDCFSEETLASLIRRLAGAATAEARWLVADFCYPRRGWRWFRARLLIATMYFFFRAVTGIDARRLVEYRPLLRAEGFECAEEMILPNEMIRSELWRRR
jgi:ubiquinone/menaquinone biosynthesis C-methylase UbiE